MKNKTFFLFNPVWIGVITAALIFIGLLLDIILYDAGRRYYLTPVGAMFCIVSGIILDFIYVQRFWGKLACKYPARKEEMLVIRDMITSYTKKNKENLSSMHLSRRNAVSYFSDGSFAYQQIDAEWQVGLKWLKVAKICLLMVLPLEAIIGNWMVAMQPSVLDFLNSIGF
ncbi:MAG: hypothetical protein IKU32_09305 [Clostridia bacterium]|nr:hypothetical protein [Clostridia bacterium]